MVSSGSRVAMTFLSGGRVGEVEAGGGGSRATRGEAVTGGSVLGAPSARMGEQSQDPAREGWDVGVGLFGQLPQHRCFLLLTCHGCRTLRLAVGVAAEDGQDVGAAVVAVV